MTNTLGPGIDPSLVTGTNAMNIFLLKNAVKKRKKDRLRHGDQLGSGLSRVPEHPSKIFIAFNSVLQGDHAGVEVACASHQQLLKNADLLDFDRCLLGTRPWIHPKEMQGLVIDDFFSIAISPKGSKLTKDMMDFDAAHEVPTLLLDWKDPRTRMFVAPEQVRSLVAMLMDPQRTWLWGWPPFRPLRKRGTA